MNHYYTLIGYEKDLEDAMTEDDDDKIVIISKEEAVCQIDNHWEKQESVDPIASASKSKPGIFHRLTAGNMFLPQRIKCVNFFKNRGTSVSKQGIL